MDPIINPSEGNLPQLRINPPYDGPPLGTGETHTRRQQAFDKALNDAERRLEKANLGNGDDAQGGGRTEQDPSQDDEENRIKIDAEASDGGETGREQPDSGNENSEDAMEECDGTTDGSGAKSDEEMKDDDSNTEAAADGQKPPSPIAAGRRPWRFDVLSPPILRS